MPRPSCGQSISLLPVAAETKVEVRGRVTSVALNHDGTILVDVVDRRSVTVRSALDGRKLRRFPDANAPIHALDISASSKLLAIGGAHKTVERDGPPWAWETTIIFKNEGATDALGTGGAGQSLKALNYRRPLQIPVLNKRWSEDSKGSVTVWNLQTGDAQKIVDNLAEPIHALSFHEDETRLAIVDRRFGCSTVALNGPDTPVMDYHIPIESDDFPAPQTSFSRDGMRLVSLEPTMLDRGNINIKLVDNRTKRILFVSPLGRADPFSSAISPDGRSFVSAGVGGTVKIWNFEVSEVVRKFESPTNQAVTFVTFDSHGKLVAACDRDGLLSLWDVNAGKQILSARVSKEGIRAIAFGDKYLSVVSGGFREGPDQVMMPLLIQRISINEIMNKK